MLVWFVLGISLTLAFLSALAMWRSTARRLRELRETTDDIRAWDAGYLSGSSGRHARTPDNASAHAVRPLDAPKWYDTMSDWASAHEPAVPAVPKPPKLQPSDFCETRDLGRWSREGPVIGVDVTRAPQIEPVAFKRKLGPESGVLFSAWGPEAVKPVVRQRSQVYTEVNAWLTGRLDRLAARVFPSPAKKVDPRTKRVYVGKAYRGGTR
jgi:hypothetical protein